MSEDSQATEANAPLRALAVSGGRGRAACIRMAATTSDLAAALRRSVPFLSRRCVAVVAEPPRCIAFAELAEDVSILHATPIAVARVTGTRATGGRGLVLIDDTALGRILDGVLGGEGSSSLASTTLTSAQNALAARVVASMLRMFGDVVATRLGLTLEKAPANDVDGGSAVVVTLAIEGGGRVLIALPLAVVPTDETAEVARVDEGIAAAMTDVELDVIAELGKVRLPLDALAQLKVGDVLRLGLPLDERARVCAGGAILFHGRPTASGEVVGVAIERRVA